MQPHDRFHAGFLIQLLSFVPPTYLHSCLLIEATDGPGRYLAAGLLASHLLVVAVRFAVLTLGDTARGHVVFCRVGLSQWLGQIVAFTICTGPKDVMSTRVYVLCLISMLTLPLFVNSLDIPRSERTLLYAATAASCISPLLSSPLMPVSFFGAHRSRVLETTFHLGTLAVGALVAKCMYTYSTFFAVAPPDADEARRSLEAKITNLEDEKARLVRRAEELARRNEDLAAGVPNEDVAGRLRRISDPGGSEREENLARVNSALESRMRDMVKEFDEEKTLLAAKVDQLVEQLKAENARLASEKERVEGEKQRLYYDYKKLLRRGSSKSTRGSATSARSAPVQGSPRLAHPRSSSSSAPADLLPSLDERRASFFTASDDSDEAATTRAETAGEEGGAN